MIVISVLELLSALLSGEGPSPRVDSMKTAFAVSIIPHIDT